MSLPNEPIGREETYLAKIAGQDVSLPSEPISRQEAYLDYIAKHGGGGSGYINITLLTEAYMYGYNVPTSDAISTKT